MEFYNYIKENPHFIQSILLDLSLLPGILISDIIKFLHPKNIDRYFNRTNKPIILIIPGIITNDVYYLLSYLLFLRKDYNVYILNLKKNDTLENLVIELRCKIKNINEEFPNKNINLIGHSQGGIVAYEYYMKYPKLIDKVITINTPWNGAKSVDILNLQNYKYLSTKNPYFQWLNAQKIKHVISIGSYHDFHVPAPLCFSKNSKKYIIPNAGHLNIILRPNLWNLIKNIIQ